MKPLSLLLFSMITLLMSALYSGYGIRLNQSPSLPQSIYFSKPVDTLYLNQIVAFRLPKSPATFAKIVAGLPGDSIEIRNHHFYINGLDKGALIANVEPLQEKVIPEGFFFAMGTHPDSFDSRYEEFGLVPQSFIQEELCPIF
jgi:conjugal transfer pilin signal peptidase TrbI